ncbi:class I SAM-dependent methyltransferase [Actinospica sp.]|jgi:SAM-dependent methyltransferase|uniref:class I SAM-dependent methyltransferase n=1 Tax=Actinospica sp. TaxID=1872142 RepID=UPI002CF248FC|nr:class I SAM-dependent methyltransferase [Actinospica sp.]HWG22570.1 class I SAM-dependent methyltransferase [Actinospica sp.]
MTSELSLNRLAPLTPNAWLRYDVIQRMMPPGVTDVLEIGCGQGALGARLSARYHYVGLEPDPESFAVAEGRFARLENGQVRNASVATLAPEDRFDLVCAFEVLEHIEDDEKALTQWAEHLRPGGWLLLSVPAHQRRYAAADEAVGHFRRYDPDKLAELVRNIGFEDVKVREYGAPLGYLLEFGRNAISRRKLKKLNDASMEQRTGASGRLFQPANPAVSALTHYGTAPFRYLQRGFPHGPGVVVRAKRP